MAITQGTARHLPDKVKTVVVGAGISGLYTAWRLLNETVDHNDIIILEKTTRVGGRLYTDLISDSSGHTLKEEEGGMRFLLEDMDNLMAVLYTLDLSKDIVPFPMNDYQNRRYYIRGKVFCQQSEDDEHHQIWSELYNLNPEERGKSPQDLMDEVFAILLQANPDLDLNNDIKTPEAWQQLRIKAKWNGKALNQMSLWQLLAAMGYSHECIMMISQTLGFTGTILSTMNAGSALQLIEEFVNQAQFYSLKKGYGSITDMLAKTIGEQKIFLNTQLEGVSINDQGKYRQLHCVYSDANGHSIRKIIEAENVILALPRLALETICMQSNLYQHLDQKQFKKLSKILSSTTQQPLLKVNLYYDYAWWMQDQNITKSLNVGPHFTDVPLGSIYPFYTLEDSDIAMMEYIARVDDLDPEAEKIVKKSQQVIYGRMSALTIYCDYININYWYSLQNNGPYFNSPLQSAYTKKKQSRLLPASVATVNAITDYLKHIFSCEKVPQPILSSVRLWESNPELYVHPTINHCYGYHQWAIGVNDKEIIASMIEMLPGVYTCGEAFSDYQGWVEGALRSANLVLEKHFGLPAFVELFKQKYGYPAAQLVRKI